MQVPRSNHASCQMGKKMYFYAGLDSNQKRLNSIEWIDMETGDRPETGWFEKESTEWPIARELPVFAPVSDTKIAIMGGIS